MMITVKASQGAINDTLFTGYTSPPTVSPDAGGWLGGGVIEGEGNQRRKENETKITKAISKGIRDFNQLPVPN
ncbi:hypothetical protein ACFLU8_04930 [Chloroflexota bacterium]